MGSKVTPLVINPGRMVLTDSILYFQPYNNAERDTVIKIKLESIRRIFQRRYLHYTFLFLLWGIVLCLKFVRYLLRPLGLEIEYCDDRGRRQHIYLTFNKPEDRQVLYHKLIQQQVPIYFLVNSLVIN